MVKIRLMRMGAKKRLFFRVVVADSRSPRDGRFIENIGKYHPLNDPSIIEIDEDRALHWLGNGAQPSDAVKVLLHRIGIWDKFKPDEPPRQRADKGQRLSKKAATAAAAAAEAPPEPPKEETAAEPAAAESEAAPQAEASTPPAEATTPETPAEEAPAEAPAEGAPAEEAPAEPAAEGEEK